MKMTLSPEEYDIEFGCKRGVVTGAKFYSEQIKKAEKDGRIRNISDLTNQKKGIVCDIGGTTAKTKDLFAMWFYQMNKITGRVEIMAYDQLESADESTLFEAVQKTKYNIGQIILPWDGSTGIHSTEKVMKELFPQAQVSVMQRTKKINMIREARKFFPMCEFNEQKTIIGMNCLRNYSKEFDKTKRIYLVSPRHDQYSHGADAFNYLALAHSRNLLVALDDDSSYTKGVVNYAETYDPNEAYNNRQGAI